MRKSIRFAALFVGRFGQEGANDKTRVGSSRIRIYTLNPAEYTE